MAISYQGAFDKMQEKGVTTYRIRKENILSQSTLQKMRDGKYVTTETIERLCLLLDCTPNDLMKITKERHPRRTQRRGRFGVCPPECSIFFGADY